MKKNLNLITAIAIIGFAACSGCTKSSSSINSNIVTTSYYYNISIKTNINAPYWQNLYGAIATTLNGNMGEASIIDTQMQITGYDTVNIYYPVMWPQINLFINPYKGAGTYIIGGTGSPGNSCSIEAEYQGAGVAAFGSGSIAYNTIKAVYGTVTITATTPNLAGTFSFTCADSTKVTNGSFTATP